MSHCKICMSSSTKTLSKRHDFEFDNPKQLIYWKCDSPKCGLIYADPAPADDEIQTFYNDYSTHYRNYTRKIINPISSIHKIYKHKEYKSFFLRTCIDKIKVLDFGCGNGNLLDFLKDYGVKKLYGYDFDIKALKLLANKGYYIYNRLTEVENSCPYDFIFMNHVIEHLKDGKQQIKHLMSLLDKDGYLIIRTPNSSSFLADLFGFYWRGWETPRHLNIYNYTNINSLVGEFSIVSKYTSNLSFSGAYHESFRNYFRTDNFFLKFVRHFFLPIFFTVASILNFIFKNKGDELCIILKKQ